MHNALVQFCALPALLLAADPHAAPPISLHPENPHYLIFRGKPTVLVGSTEHYGSVLNLDFNYRTYLDELKRDGLNLTRAFTGTYRETPGSFGITGNTLAPAGSRFCAPWARSGAPGYADGGSKFDLTKWDEAYFARLKDFIREAGKRGIVVELSLFSPMYDDSMWAVCPMNSRNNVNGIGAVGPHDPFTMRDTALQDVQDAFVRKVVTELREYDNLYYEICNEPYFGGVTLEWQTHIASIIDRTEAGLHTKHMVAQNFANQYAKVDRLIPGVSIANFHYAEPRAAGENLHLNAAMGDDETGFVGSADAPYRTEAWQFMLSGGAIYDNLDYSFTVGHEDGTAEINAPGGGGKALRTQLRVMKEFLTSFDIPKLTPSPAVVTAGVPADGAAYVLADPRHAYAIYLRGGSQATLTLDLPEGRYTGEWLSTLDGKVEKRERFTHGGGTRDLASPEYLAGDVALRLRRK